LRLTGKTKTAADVMPMKVDQMVKGLMPMKVDQMVKGLMPMKVDQMVKGLMPMKADQMVKGLMPMKADQMFKGLAQTPRIIEQIRGISLSLRPVVREHPFLAATHALDAVLAGDRDTVVEFADRWLCLAGQQLEGVEESLLENEWKGLDPEKVMSHLRKQALIHTRAQRPIWRRQIAGRRIISLDQPFKRDSNAVLGDLVCQVEDPISRLIERLAAKERLQRLITRLAPEERRILLQFDSTGTWADAARAEGFPAARGDAVRKKLRRWALRIESSESGS